jgi:hypothetical protein
MRAIESVRLRTVRRGSSTIALRTQSAAPSRASHALRA